MKFKKLLFAAASTFVFISTTACGDNYETVKIGGLEWMVENLNKKTDNSWCIDDREENCKVRGRLYTFDAAMKACPSGWHVPTIDDIKQSSQNSEDASALEILLSSRPGGSMEKPGKFEHKSSTYLWINFNGKPGQSKNGRVRDDYEMGQSLRCVR